MRGEREAGERQQRGVAPFEQAQLLAASQAGEREQRQRRERHAQRGHHERRGVGQPDQGAAQESATTPASSTIHSRDATASSFALAMIRS